MNQKSKEIRREEVVDKLNRKITELQDIINQGKDFYGKQLDELKNANLP